MLDLITTYMLNFKTIDFPAKNKLEWYNGFLNGLLKVSISERQPLNSTVVKIETNAIFRV